MEIAYYIKQIVIFRKKLDDWGFYLKKLHENTLGSKNSSIRIVELYDRKDLIKCDFIKTDEICMEIKKIHELIDQEKIAYAKLYDLILKYR